MSEKDVLTPELCANWTGGILTTCYLATTSNTRQVATDRVTPSFQYH